MRLYILIAIAITTIVIVAYHVTSQRADTTCVKIADSISIAGTCR